MLGQGHVPEIVPRLPAQGELPREPWSPETGQGDQAGGIPLLDMAGRMLAFAHEQSHCSMKIVFSSPDSAQIGLAQSILEAADIACEVRNEAVHQAVPGMPFSPELWVVRDEDYPEARRLVRSVGAGPSPSGRDG